MKTIRKTMAIILAAVFVIGAALPAMAAGLTSELETEPSVNENTEPSETDASEALTETGSSESPADAVSQESPTENSSQENPTGAASPNVPIATDTPEILTETIEDVPVTNMATGDGVTVDVELVSDADTVTNAEFREMVEDIESIKTAAESPVLLMALGASGGNKTVYLYNDGVVSYGGYGTHKYRVTIDGKTTYAYCLEPPKAGPDNGNYTATPATNALLAKALYYMMGGPAYGQPVTTKSGRTFQHGLAGNISSTGAGTDDEYALSHCILSYIYAGDAAFAGIDSIQSVVQGVKAWAVQLEDFPDPPAGYTAYTIATPGQTMGFAGELIPDGYIKLTKSSANSGITKDNRMYSLQGAVYGVYSDSGCTKSVGNLTTKADGSTNTLQLEAGTYYVKEKTASKGYLLDATVYTVKVLTDNTESSPVTVKAKEVPASDSLFIDIRKMDSDGKDVPDVADIPQGDASLADAEFRIDYYDANEASGTAKRSWTFKGNAEGLIDLTDESFLKNSAEASMLYKDSSDKITYPLGTYVVTEIKAPEGYKPMEDPLTGHVTLSGQAAAFSWDSGSSGHVINREDETEGIGNIVFQGGVRIHKLDDEKQEDIPQGDASLAGAQFVIINKSFNPVVVDGKACIAEDTVLTITTDEAGVAESASDALPYGTYEIRESDPSTGYLINSAWSQPFEIREDGVIVDLTGEPCDEAVIRGGVAIEKGDKELDKNEALGGATLEGIEFTITNASKNHVYIDGESYDHGTVVTKLYTDIEGKASLEGDTLPYGTYTIKETKTNDTYLLTDGEARTFTIREDGVVVTVDTADDELIFRNQVIRNDIRFNKIADTSNARMQNIPFVITQVMTGEQHVVVTDKNGTFNSASKSNPHSRNTNGNDSVLEGYVSEEEAAADGSKEPTVIMTTDLDDKAGIWFELGQAGSTAAVDDTLGAFPYGEYRMQELRSENNEGYDLLDITFFIEEDFTEEEPVDLGTLTDDEIIPQIRTVARDKETGEHFTKAGGNTTVIDTVHCVNLIKGKSYVLRATLMDGSANTVKAGKSKVTGETVFKATDSVMDVEVELAAFDPAPYAGQTVTVYEKLYAKKLIGTGKELASHEEIDDKDQQIVIPQIKTNAVAKDTSKHETTAAKQITVLDRVAYRNVIPGRKLTVKGRLVSKKTGKVIVSDGKEVTAQVTFTPGSPEGYVDLAFSFDGSALGGDTVVAFEQMYDGNDLIAIHEDLQDADQSVVIDKPETPPLTPTPENPKSTTPGTQKAAPVKTGDASMPVLWTALASAAAGAGIWFGRKRKH